MIEPIGAIPSCARDTLMIAATQIALLASIVASKRIDT